MAEIKIEKKKPIWPWIVALLLVAAVIYYVFFRDNSAANDGSVEIENTTSENIRTHSNEETVLNKNSAVAFYKTYSNNKQLQA